MRSVRIAFPAAALLIAALIVGWSLFGQELALAKAIDDALRNVKSAHFTAVEGTREIEVWATQNAERVTLPNGWMVANGGRAYIYDTGRKHLTITKGGIAHLQLLRNMNVLLLLENLRGQAMGKPTVTQQMVSLPDGKKALRISASGKKKLMGVVCSFQGKMLVDPDSHLILSGEASESLPDTAQAKRLVRQGRLRSMHVRVDSIEYNLPAPQGTFDMNVPEGWTVTHKT